jgi:cobalt/nickel transport system permease protein
MASNLAFLDRYLEGDSAIHNDDARVKVVVTLGFIFAMTSLPAGAWPAFGIMYLLLWSMVLMSQLGAGRILRRSFLALPFVLVALPTVFTRAGSPLFELNLGFMHLTATQQGLEFFVSVLLKSWASVTGAVLLTATTPFVRILEALRALRVPRTLIAIVSFMYRYLFVLVDESQRLLRARSARSAHVSDRAGGTIRWRAKTAGGMAGSLFVRTYDRSERIYQAMLARGYDGQVRQLNTPSLSTNSLLRGGLALGAFAAVAISAQFLW